MKAVLTKKLIEAFSVPTVRTVISDLATSNLSLVVSPRGAKTWTWIGRVGGDLVYLTLGRYPAYGLTEARAWATEVTTKRDRGEDVRASKRAQKEQIEYERKVAEAASLKAAKEQGRTCDWAFALYMHHEGSKRASGPEKARSYNRDVSPFIGDKLLSSVTHDDLAELLQKKLPHAPVGSIGLRRMIRRWMRWSVINRHLTGLTDDPAKFLPQLASESPRERALDDFELGIALKAIESHGRRMRDPLKLIIYTGARKSEAFEAEWSELNFEKGEWLIPAARTKNRVPHLLPLTSEMVAMLVAIPRTPKSKLIWPARGNLEHGMGDFSKAIARIRDQMNELAKPFGRTIAHRTIHDLRRSTITGMYSLLDADDRPLIQPHIVERIANHKQETIKGIYNKHHYYLEKKMALRAWAEHLRRVG